MRREPVVLSRRAVVAGSGALIISFSAFGGAQKPHDAGPQGNAPGLPGSLEVDPHLDAWIRIDAAGTITVFTGKAELGQGIKTAIVQIAAEQLDVGPGSIKLVTADTGFPTRQTAFPSNSQVPTAKCSLPLSISGCD